MMIKNLSAVSFCSRRNISVFLSFCNRQRI